MEFLSEGINQSAQKKVGIKKSEENVAIFIRDDTSKLYGGVGITLYLGCLYIRYIIYIIEEIRNQGYATRLIARAEEIAKENNCGFMALHTHEWQAKRLYENLGFKVKYVESGYKLNSKLYYMVKILALNSGYSFISGNVL